MPESKESIEALLDGQEVIKPPYSPPPIICCCVQPEMGSGVKVIDAGCRIHGIRSRVFGRER